MVSSEWWHVGKAAFILATIVTTMGGVPVYVVEYTVAHAAPPQHFRAQAVEPLVVGLEATAVVSRRISGGLAVVFDGRAKLLLNFVVNLLAAKLELCRQAGWWHCAGSYCDQ